MEWVCNFQILKLVFNTSEFFLKKVKGLLGHEIPYLVDR